jgi:hypothetical protein
MRPNMHSMTLRPRRALSTGFVEQVLRISDGVDGLSGAML